MASEIPGSLRVAVEGCGHGKLHDIYSSVADSAKKKGWDGVDLLIIGGDFQAVRNSNDLTCMAVPPKYKDIGDFHEYYSGARVAPYLTVFVGGNHEASNHLFELYYGGWVAPNIYYLGAANVIRCGPFRIAGMSGIWKGYNYNKPHFERLPYNEETLRSIYHVREIDVRKLLQIRTQVDIGISHDWPQGVEWTGDYQKLFTRKPLFIEDANSGRLGSVAAKQVLERIRPCFWFSAHLHCKYVSTIEHGEYVAPTATPQRGPLQRLPQLAHNPDSGNEVSMSKPTDAEHNGHPEIVENAASNIIPKDDGEQAKKYAWNDFHNVAAKNEKEEHEKHMQKASEYHRQVAAGTIKPGSDINYQVTWRKVGITDDGLGREVQEVIRSETKEGQVAKEEAGVEVKNADEIDIDIDSDSGTPEKSEPGANVTTSLAAKDAILAQVKNTDEIDIDSVSGAHGKEEPGAGPTTLAKETPFQVKNVDEIDMNVDTMEDGSSKLETNVSSPMVENANPAKNPDEMNVEPDTAAGDSHTATSNVTPTISFMAKGTVAGSGPKVEDASVPSNTCEKYDISNDLRDQLPESFRKAKKAKITPVIEPTLPEGITNAKTEFLALDKCDRNREFIQLMELHPSSEADKADMERPYQLKYDKEWLAITRVLAEGFEVGNIQVPVPKNKGDGGYKPEIIASEAWVEENVIKPGKMTIPQNFSITAPVYDESVPILTNDQPPEYVNPQTAEFCELIGIENRFHLSDEDRQAQLEAIGRSNAQGGIRSSGRQYQGRGNRGGHRGRGRGRGWGRGRGRG